MDKIEAHHVVLHQLEIQPSSDHVLFAAGGLDKDLDVEVPTDAHYMPLATWIGMGSPDTITITAKSGRQLP